MILKIVTTLYFLFKKSLNTEVKWICCHFIDVQGLYKQLLNGCSIYIMLPTYKYEDQTLYMFLINRKRMEWNDVHDASVSTSRL